MLFTFSVLRLKFTLEAVDPINLPSYKGSAFHGGFGHALQTISPTWFRYFFQTTIEKGASFPKPFALVPPLDTQQTYQAGEKFCCELTLFGEAVQHYAIVQAAIEYLGNEMGLGYHRGKFKISDINQSDFSYADIAPETLTIELNTRLRLKTHNHLLKHSPEFSVLIKSLLTRLKTLQHYHGDTSIDSSLYQHLLQQSQEIKIVQSNIYWDEWDRYSGSQKEWMKFGGLLGEISYQGKLQPFMPYLQMGEWTHVGGKSSFGLGKYSIVYGDD